MFVNKSLSLLSAVVMLLAACVAQPVQASPRELARDTQQAVQHIKEEEPDLFSRVREDLHRLEQLNQEIQQGGDPAKMLDRSVKELERATGDFEDILDRRGEVSKDIRGRIQRLQELRDSAQAEKVALLKRRAQLRQEAGTGGVVNPEVVRVREKSFAQAERYIDAQVQIWDQFVATHGALQKEVDGAEERVEAFWAILEATTLVYREALNLLTLQRDLREALTVLTQDLPELQQLSADMEASWQTVDSLVGTLLSLGLQQAAPQGPGARPPKRRTRWRRPRRRDGR